MNRLFRLGSVLSLVALLALLAPPATGVEGVEGPKPPPGRKGKPALTGDREIYVPFQDLKKVFEKEGRGVFVPYEEFMKLWRANLDRRPVPEKPPVPWLVTRATYEGRVEGGLAVFSATIEFETFHRGYTAVPLGFSGVALGKALLGKEPATLEATKAGYRVIVPEKGAYTLGMEFVTPIRKAGDARTIAFRMPPTPVSRITFDVPEEGARVTVEPNLATTRTGAAPGVTRVMAYAGAAESLKLTWKPRPVEVKVGPALVFADTITTANVEEAALRVRQEIAYTIHRAPVEAFDLSLVGDGRVLFVEGPGVASWERKGSTLHVRLVEPAKKTCRLTVTLERDLPEGKEIPAPRLRCLTAALGKTVSKVAREQGFVLVRAPSTVKVATRAEGLFRTDFRALPEACRSPAPLRAWRHATSEWSLYLTAARIRPRIEIQSVARFTLDERSLTAMETLVYKVDRAPIFQARIGLPKDVEIRDVTRDAVEDWRVEQRDGARTLVLDLKGGRTGSFPVMVTLHRALAVGKEPVEIALPFLEPSGPERFTGTVGIFRDEALKLETRDVAGLVPMPAARFDRGASLAFRHLRANRKLTLAVSRRDPEVTAAVATSLRAEENRIAVKTLVTFTVRYAGVDAFSFTLPAELRDRVRVTGNDIREQPKEDAGEGRFRQRIVLQGKVTGTWTAAVEYDLPYEGLEVGGSTTISIPVLVVEGVKREEGVYAVYREPMLEIRAKTERVEPIDPRELPAPVDRKNVFLAFRYLSHPHSLALTVEKHAFREVLAAVVHHLHLVTALNDEGAARTDALLKITNNGLQFLSLKLEPGAVLESLEVFTRAKNGAFVPRREKPQAGADGAFLVRMPPDQGPNDVFWVKLRYRPGGKGLPGLVFHRFTYAAPVVEEGRVPVVGTSWVVVLPRDVRVTGVGGSLAWLERPDSWWETVVRASPEVFTGRTPPGRARSRKPPVSLAPGLASDLDRAGGLRLTFGGRSLSPSVSVTFADPGTTVFLRVLVFLLVLGGGILGLARLAPGARTACLAGGVAVPLLLIPVASLGLADLLNSVLLGTLALVLYGWVRAFRPAAVGYAAAAYRRLRGPKAGEEE